MNVRLDRAVLALACGLLLANSGGNAFAAENDRLRVAYASPTETLDPQRTASNLSGSLLKSVFETLVRLTPEGKLEGLLATNWKVEPDGKTWIFTLRQGVVFHDGTPFNAETVRQNVKRVLDPKNLIPLRTNIGSLADAEVVDERTVKLITSKPFSGLPIALTHVVSSMISSKSLQQWGTDLGNHQAAGTGPFRIASFALPEKVVLERNPNYWGKQPTLRQIEYATRSDPQTRLASLLSGEVDANFYLTPEGKARLQRDPNE